MWDPLGLGEAPPSEHFRIQLKRLKDGVKAFLESVQGLPMTSAARQDDVESLLACLTEVHEDFQAEKSSLEREIVSMRKTVGLLQDDRRERESSHLYTSTAAAAAPTVLDESATSDLSRRIAELEASALSARAEAAEAVRVAREEERATAVAAVTEVRAQLEAALRAERATALRSADRTADAARGRTLEAEHAAVAACFTASVAEAEDAARRAAEAQRASLQATRQRAAQMLAKKDGELARARAQAGGGDKPPPDSSGSRSSSFRRFTTVRTMSTPTNTNVWAKRSLDRLSLAKILPTVSHIGRSL